MSHQRQLLAKLNKAVLFAVGDARNEDAKRQIRNPRTQLSDDEFKEIIVAAILPLLSPTPPSAPHEEGKP